MPRLMARLHACRFFNAALGIICCAAAGGWASTAAAQPSCNSLQSVFDEALKQRIFETAKTIEDKFAADTLCNDRAVKARRRRATMQVVTAEEMKNDPAREKERLSLLHDADQPRVSWLASYALGQALFSRREYQDAARAYNQALALSRNASLTPRQPDRQEEAALLAQAKLATKLAKEKDKKETTRHCSAHRGKHPSLPILFDEGKAEITGSGNQTIEALAEDIRRQCSTEIALTGYADETGDAEYNMALSMARVEEVARRLRRLLASHGVKIKITMAWKGGDLRNFENGNHRRAEGLAFHRRVEYRFPGKQMALANRPGRNGGPGKSSRPGRAKKQGRSSLPHYRPKALIGVAAVRVLGEAQNK